MGCEGNYKKEYVPMFNDPEIWNGHSTIIKELMEQCEAVPDAIVCAVGGGGLLMGVFEGLRKAGWSERTKVVAAQSENCALFEAAKQNGFSPKSSKCVSPEGVDLGLRSMPREVVQRAKGFESFNSVKSLV